MVQIFFVSYKWKRQLFKPALHVNKVNTVNNINNKNIFMVII